MFSRRSLFLVATFLLPRVVTAQGTLLDDLRSERLEQRTRGLVFRFQVEPNRLPESGTFWYRNELPDGCAAFLLVEAEAGRRGPACDHAKLAEQLGAAVHKPVDPMRHLLGVEPGRIGVAWFR